MLSPLPAVQPQKNAMKLKQSPAFSLYSLEETDALDYKVSITLKKKQPIILRGRIP